jgi:hypothetical protein
MKNARKSIYKHSENTRKVISVNGEYGKLGLFAVHKIVSKFAENI